MPLQWEHSRSAPVTVNGKFTTQTVQMGNEEVAHRIEQDYAMVESLNKEDG